VAGFGPDPDSGSSGSKACAASGPHALPHAGDGHRRPRPVAAIKLTMNALSSVGGKVTATILQAGIG
jgi:hypothetical protein